MDVDIKSRDIQEEYDIMTIENMDNININKRKIQEVIKRSVDIVASTIGIILLIPITIRNMDSTKINKR